VKVGSAQWSIAAAGFILWVRGGQEFDNYMEEVRGVVCVDFWVKMG